MTTTSPSWIRTLLIPGFTLAVGIATVAVAQGCSLKSDNSCMKATSSRTTYVTLPDATLCAEGKHMYDVSGGYAGAVNGDLDMDFCRNVCGDVNVTGCLLPDAYAVYTNTTTCPYPSGSGADAGSADASASDGGAVSRSGADAGSADGGAAPTNAVSCTWTTYEKTTQDCNVE